MKNYSSKFKINLKFIIATFIFAFLTFNLSTVYAARLYFEPQDLVAGTEKEFLVAVNIDAEDSINAVSTAVSISEQFTPLDINEANSIINFWIEKPHWEEATRLLSFAGITPGGFSGKGGRLLVIKFKVEKEGEATLGFNKEGTKIFLNTPNGVEDTLELEEIKIPIVRGKENLPLDLPDKEPPENFSPEISSNPNLFDGKWFLVFATQDKASGIAGYFVHESTRKKEITRINMNKWVDAESPYVLKDQNLRSYIYIKAIDKAGNERIAIVEPKYPLRWYENWWLWIIIIVGVLLVAVVLRFIKSKIQYQKSK